MKGKGAVISWIKYSWLGAVSLAFLAACASSSPVREAEKPVMAKGSYQLVGIGPGDGDLMTPRAVNVLRDADLILCSPKTQETLSPYVSLEGKQILDGYGKLFPFYGKDCSNLTEGEKSRDGMSCEDYHRKQAEFATLVRKAVADGKKVAMTSGGDPTIYGPSVWTLQELKDLNPEVVPGMSSLNAANAALQVSLGEVIITAPFKKAERKDTIESLAGHDRATMVIFMPRDMKDLLARLAKAYPGNTPVAVVSHAGQKGQERVVTGTVKSVGKKLHGANDFLSLVYVGKAVGDARYRPPGKQSSSSRGRFYLVGVGPGDGDLASLRALKAIEQADVVFAHKRISDRFAKQLEGKQVIDGYHRLFPFYGEKCSQLTDAEKAREGMSCEEYHRKQAEFASMVRKAVADGKTVAILDSGDPLIYGPCSWTLTELRDVKTEVIPGLSCFNAANAALSTGVTEGRDSHSVLLASGWSVEEMAVHQSTMVLFTMRTEFKKFIDSLLKHYPSSTPVAIVSNAGYKEKENVMRGELGTILDQVGEGKLPFEYLLYVGDCLAPR